MAAFTRILGMTNAEADAICREGLASVNNRKHHMYVYQYVPLSPNTEAARVNGSPKAT
jgi:hypothetical protein